MSEEPIDKQHKPTEKHTKELKKQGQFLRSKDLVSGTVLIAGIVIFIISYEQFYKRLQNNFILSFSEWHLSLMDAQRAWICKRVAIDTALLLLPFLLVILCIPSLLGFIFGGFTISFKLSGFKWSRINPAKNIKNILSTNNAIETLKSLFKTCIFFSLFLGFIYHNMRELLSLMGESKRHVIFAAFHLIMIFLCWAIAGIVIIIFLDMLYHYYSHQKKSMMSHQQVKDEQKETDGNPEVKRKIRQTQQSMSRQHLKKVIPTATVIIVNPTHYAVALRYDEQTDKAPKVIATGIDHKAAEIRLLAIQQGIPLYSAPDLARSIYYTAKVGSFIHPSLYMAVAIVLSYINQLQLYQQGLASKPSMTDNLEIPDELLFPP